MLDRAVLVTQDQAARHMTGLAALHIGDLGGRATQVQAVQETLVLVGHNMTDLGGQHIAGQVARHMMGRVVQHTRVLEARVMPVQAAPVIQDRGALATTARGFADNLSKILHDANKVCSIKSLCNRFCQPQKYWLSR